MGRGTVGKTAVVGVRSETGEVHAEVVTDTKAPTLQAFVVQHANPGATVVTDTHGGYVGLERAGYKHIRINHSAGQYVIDMAHTNGIESFWSLLKRGYIGVYHYMSAKHLDRYVNEFSFRHNTARAGTMSFIDQTLTRSIGKRLTYKGLIHA